MRMPTLYQIEKIKKYAIISIISIFIIIVGGNIISYSFTKKITVNPQSYSIKNGFPLFTSEKDYFDFIKNYPYDAGVKLNIYTVSSFDTLWKIQKKFNITLDTLISVNPQMKDLILEKGDSIVIPSKNGTLLVFDDYSDVGRYAGMYKTRPSLQGEYSMSLFRLISPDDVRMVFFEKVAPVIVNDDIEKLYSYKLSFCCPLRDGFYTSMYGERVNPFFHKNMEFHNGIDIATRMGTSIGAAKEGMVFFSGWREGFGNTVIIQHTEGYTTLYGHCSKLYVKAGQWVTKGEKIAAVGSTGRSTGPHLHYTIFRHGKALNPIKFIW